MASQDSRGVAGVLATPALTALALTAFALTALALAGCTRAAASGWSATAAQHSLDRRAQAWLAWRAAARAQGTVCISCHTALPYMLASDALEGGGPGGPGGGPGGGPARGPAPPAPGGRAVSPAAPVIPPARAAAALPLPQQRLLASVLERVRLGTALPPYYRDQAANSRGTEAVLNALILTDHDAASGQLSRPTQDALAQMWSTQLSTGPEAGSWPWIEFQREPWEAPDSNYFGAVLAALAIERTPAEYRARPDIQPALVRLRTYLISAYAGEPLLNRIDLLWAAARWPQLMPPATRTALLAEIWAHQRQDGGWNLPSLIPAWHRRDGTPQASGSDGYATGLVTLALQLCEEQPGGASPGDPRLQRGLRWLRNHQGLWSGAWTTASPNHHFRLIHRHYDITRHFMDDAATAYAVLSLTRASRPVDVPAPAAAGTGPVVSSLAATAR